VLSESLVRKRRENFLKKKHGRRRSLEGYLEQTEKRSNKPKVRRKKKLLKPLLRLYKIIR
jgi:hypothetical protein